LHRPTWTRGGIRPAMFFPFIVVAGFAAASVPTVTLNNGVAMPLVQLGLGGYNDSYATEAVVSALGVGFTGIDTAHDYG